MKRRWLPIIAPALLGLAIGVWFNLSDLPNPTIFLRIDASASRNKIPLDAVIFGKLIVLHTEKTTSTVYIIATNRQIDPGSKICTPLE